MVSLRVFGTESHYICQSRYHFGLCIKKVYYKKNAVMSVYINWSPLGEKFQFSDEYPHHFYEGVSRV